MKPYYSLLVTCPHCGKDKELMRLRSGNTMGAECWSDTKVIAPMLPKISLLQKCPHCEHFYLVYKEKQKSGTGYSFEEGWLTFAEAKKAVEESKEWILDDEDKYNINMHAIWAYNDMVLSGKIPSDEDYKAFKTIVETFLPHIKERVLAAELHRETGNFAECLAILDKVDIGNDPIRQHLIEGITCRAKAGDTTVWRYHGDAHQKSRVNLQKEDKDEQRKVNGFRNQSK